MIEKQVQEKPKHTRRVLRGKQGTNKTKKLRRIKTTSIDQIRQRTERENTGQTKFGRKKSLSLELIFLFLQKSKNSSPPKYQLVGDHVPNHPISMFTTKLAWPTMLETR